MESREQQDCPYCHGFTKHTGRVEGKTLQRKIEWWDWIRKTRKRKSVRVYMVSPEFQHPRLRSSIMFRDNPESIFDLKIKFCPMCGRKLGGDQDLQTKHRRPSISDAEAFMAVPIISQQKSQLPQIADSSKTKFNGIIPQEENNMIQVTIAGETLDELKHNFDQVAATLGTTGSVPETWAPEDKSDAPVKDAPAPIAEPEPKPEAPEVTKVDIQKAMKAVLDAGNKDGIRGYMEDTLNAEKLSEVSKDDYPEFLAALKEMA